MRPWFDIYSERMNECYFNHVKSKYKPFISEVINAATYPGIKRVVEIGCGAGNITRALTRSIPAHDVNFMMIDSCPKMLLLASCNVPYTVKVYHQDILTAKFAYQLEGGSVVHSHGLLEHFKDEHINQIISDNSECDQVHYVPTAKYEIPSRGDERLMTVDQWFSVLKSNTKVIFDLETFNDDHDLIIRTWKK